MKIYLKDNVYQAALNRIRYLFDEFENVVVGFSGGKDSTVVFHLAMEIAKEKNRLPLKVLFIDQEAEWQSTVDYVETIMTCADVEPFWFQMPMVITNNASAFERYAHCWDETEKEHWIHPKHLISIKKNKYGTDRFHDLFNAIFRVEFDGRKSCLLGGVRTEESPSRQVGLTCGLTYNHITWGKVLNKKLEHYTFYPLYDWSYTDVWKYIFDGKIPYNKIYDYFYSYGVKLSEMRVSNLHHETAIHHLTMVQEIEPQTWARLEPRICGANTIKHLKKESFTCPDDLPPMFEGWKSYALYLADSLIQEMQYKKLLVNKINQTEKIYDGELIVDDYWRVIVNTILSSDWDFTKLNNWVNGKTVTTYRKIKLGNKYIRVMLRHTSYLTANQKQKLVEYFQNERLQTISANCV